METLQSRKLYPYQSFILITVVMIVFIAVQIAGVFFLSGNTYLYQAICEILGLAIPVLLFLLITNRVKDNIHIGKVSSRNLLIITAVVTLSIPFSMLLATFNMWVVENLFNVTSGIEDSIVIGNFEEYIKSILVMALIPAICEEIAFRTAFMAGLERLGKTLCFFFVSLFFSLAHMIPEKLLSTFALSVLLCYFLYRTGSILSAILGHFINNFIALTITFATKDIPSGDDSAEILKAYGFTEYSLSFIVWGGLALMVLPLIIILFRKFNRYTETTKIIITKELKMDGSALAAFLPAFTVFIILVAMVIVNNILTGL